jgi:hypothetical protein
MTVIEVSSWINTRRTMRRTMNMAIPRAADIAVLDRIEMDGIDMAREIPLHRGSWISEALLPDAGSSLLWPLGEIGSVR